MRNTDFQVCAPAEFYSAAMQSENSGKNPRWAHRPQACVPIIATNLIATSHRLEALCVLVSNLAPDNVFVISTVNKRVDFSVLIVTKQNSPLDTFAEEKLGCFRK